LTTVLGYCQWLLGILADDVTLLTLLEPLVGFGAESWCLSMFEERIAQDIAFGIETYKYLQVATETTCGTFDSSTQILALSILGLVDNIGEFLALGIVLLHGVGPGDSNIANAHHRLDTIGQRLCLLGIYWTFCHVVH